MNDAERVIVVTGAGGMGAAIAARLGAGSSIVIADSSSTALNTLAGSLREQGHTVVEHVTDVSNRASVGELAELAVRQGRVEVVVHTAGMSPVQAEVGEILRVDVLGTALVLDAFASRIAQGGAGVFISSMAGVIFPQGPELERKLATTATDELLSLPELAADVLKDPGIAYGVAKRANQVRVKAASVEWGRRGARVNSLSPGIISTPMGAAELAGPSGAFMREMLTSSPAGRIGTPQDIAAAVEFLVSPQAAYITGIDLLVDGGVCAALSIA